MTKDLSQLTEYYLTLARWGDCYPYGIPLSEIDRAYAEQSELPESDAASERSLSPNFRFHRRFSDSPSRAIFFVSEEPSEDELQLLRAAVSKGLQWEVSTDVGLLVMGSEEDLSHNLSETLRDYHSCWWVVLGDDRVGFASRCESENPHLKLMRTCDLSEMVTEPAMKKVFWNDIRKMSEAFSNDA